MNKFKHFDNKEEQIVYTTRNWYDSMVSIFVDPWIKKLDIQNVLGNNNGVLE
jgi:hypothetical protein